MIIIFIWNITLTVAFLLIFLHNRKARLRGQLASTDELKSALVKLQTWAADQDQRSKKFLQKVGFVRFNPFEETGGAQSFSIALLDKENDGFVLTSLHSRGGTRTYAKLIERGKSKFKLSKEEENALNLVKENE